MVIASEIKERYPALPELSPIGQELDWAWLAGHKSEWGVQPKPGPRGLTMMDVAVGSYGEVPDHPRHRSAAGCSKPLRTQAARTAGFQPSQLQIARPITCSRSSPLSHRNSSVNIVTHCR